MTDPSHEGSTEADAEADELLSLIQHMSTERGPATPLAQPPQPDAPGTRPAGQPILAAEFLPPTIAAPGTRSVAISADEQWDALPGEPLAQGEDDTAAAAAPAVPSRPLARTQARTRALEILFAAEVRERPPEVLLEAPDAGWVDEFTRTLVMTVATHAGQLDEIIEKFARGWTVDRMPAVDRCILRLGLTELMHLDEVPPRVAIDEAVELAKSLSTDDSPKFINGVLAAVARDRQLL